MAIYLAVLNNKGRLATNDSAHSSQIHRWILSGMALCLRMGVVHQGDDSSSKPSKTLTWLLWIQCGLICLDFFFFFDRSLWSWIRSKNII